MSVGIEIGLGDLSPELLGLLSRTSAGTPMYVEPAGIDGADFYGEFGGMLCFGRSARDHNSASQLAAFSAYALSAGIAAGALEPFTKFEKPYVLIPRTPSGALEELDVSIVGADALHTALVSIAPHIGLSLNDGVLSDSQAQAINDGEGDDSLIDFQVVWLLLFEAARLCSKTGTALVLA